MTQVCFAPDDEAKIPKIMKNSSLLSSPKVLFKIIEGVLHLRCHDGEPVDVWPALLFEKNNNKKISDVVLQSH